MIRKILVQDIVSSRGSKSGKDTKGASVSENRASNARERDFLIERLTRKHATENPPKTSRTTTRRKKDSKSRFGLKWLWYIAPVILILIVFLVMQFFAGAEITITPKVVNFSADNSLLASNVIASTSNLVSYQVITLSAKDSQIVLSTSSVATVPKKATGQIVVFNNFSSAPQVLVKNTRFETVEGLVYRTTSAVKIPGITAGVPGNATINVVADQTGSKYNIGLADFTIPGFKTDATRYAKIFGRSKTVMSGGVDSKTLGIASDVRANAKSQIEARLVDSLQKQVQAEKTADSVIFDGASKISFQPFPDLAGADAQHAVIQEQGTISALVFDKKNITKILAADAITQVGNSADVHGVDGLHFTSNISTTTPAWTVKSFSFNLAGPLKVVGLVDVEKLTQSIKGLSRESLPAVLRDYLTIDKVDVSIQPFWENFVSD